MDLFSRISHQHATKQDWPSCRARSRKSSRVSICTPRDNQFMLKPFPHIAGRASIMKTINYSVCFSATQSKPTGETKEVQNHSPDVSPFVVSGNRTADSLKSALLLDLKTVH